MQHQDLLVDKFGKQFVVTAELEPPRGSNVTDLLQQALELKPFVSAVNITDSPMASLRMNSIVAAHLVERDLGLESIFHFTCRDRNSLALQAELLGASALGLKNVLALTGDPVTRGDHPHATPVFEQDLLGLVTIIKTLNEGRSQGKDLSHATSFTIAAAANPSANDLSVEKSKLLAKEAAGASFFQTQPVFSLEEVLKFQDVFGGQPPAPVLYGILPLRSAKMAQRVAKWCKVPQELSENLEKHGVQAGLEWARQLIQDVKAAGITGVHLYPLGKTSIVKDILSDTTELVSA